MAKSTKTKREPKTIHNVKFYVGQDYKNVTDLTNEQYWWVDHCMAKAIVDYGRELFEGGKYRLAYGTEGETIAALNDVLGNEGFLGDEYDELFDETYNTCYYNCFERLREADWIDDTYADVLEEKLQEITKETKAIRKELKRINEV